MGIGLFIFAKANFSGRITKVGYDTVKFGFLGKLTHKVKLLLD